MVVTYTNRKGRKYYLCQGVTKTGKPRYYFSREQKGNVVDEIPAGYEITESVNGVVSLSKVRPKLLLDAEINKVRKAIEKHPEGHKYRIDVKSKVIMIYEPLGPDMHELADILASGLGLSGAALEDLGERLAREHEIYTRYTPVMRFTLSDTEKRLFRAERVGYSGEGSWIDVEDGKPIEELAESLIPTLGTDEFFELW